MQQKLNFFVKLTNTRARKGNIKRLPLLRRGGGLGAQKKKQTKTQTRKKEMAVEYLKSHVIGINWDEIINVTYRCHHLVPLLTLTPNLD